ncbi:MAG TPA: hypothetical protein VLA36_03580 [Longimicrobiales bacterium]|nr:hypothetical protein [Longimicrobiales bacterium]
MRLFPPQPFLGDVVRTTLVIWVGFHFAFAVGGGGPEGSALALPPVVAGVLLALVVGASHLDRSARGVTLFLANLGLSTAKVSLLALAVAGLAEMGLQIVVRLLK